MPTALFLGDTRLAADRADMRLLPTHFLNAPIVQLAEHHPVSLVVEVSGSSPLGDTLCSFCVVVTLFVFHNLNC